MVTSPRTAIIIPCFNDGPTVGETIASATEQEPCEIIVVNDGSSDPGTLDVLKEFEAAGHRVIHQENKGLAAARMAGVEASTARFILPLDSDDRLVPGAAKVLADALDSRPDAGVCWGDTRMIGERGGLHQMQEVLDPWLISYLNPMGYSALFRRETIEAAGGWQIRGGYEDWDLWMSIAEKGITGFRVPQPTFLYRIHGSRFWAEAAQRHDDIYAELCRRHPGLLAARKENLRKSPAPFLVRFFVPRIEGSQRLSRRNKRRLSFVLRAPRSALLDARGRGGFKLRRHREQLESDTLILCYHAVSETWPAELTVTSAAFEDQLRGLLRRGYRPVTLSQSQEERIGPAKRLVVTFDDGYLSTLDRAAPIMERLGIPGTLFVPTKLIGIDGPMSWPGIDRWLDTPYRDELTPLTWDQVRELTDRGWEIGSHTVTHPHLTELGDDDLERELTASKAKVEAELGGPCPTIAYPYGAVDDRVAAAAKAAGYTVGVDLPARWHGRKDPLLLPRIAFWREDGPPIVAAKSSRVVRTLRIATRR